MIFPPCVTNDLGIFIDRNLLRRSARRATCEEASQGTGLARRKKVAGPSVRTIAEQTQTAFHPRHPVWQIARRRGLFRRGRSAFLFPSTLQVRRWIFRRPLNGRNNLFDGETFEQKVGSSVCQRPAFRFLIEESGKHQPRNGSCRVKSRG